MGEKAKRTILGIMDFIKTYVLFMNHKDDKNKMRSLKLVFEVSVVVLAITFYPQIKKVIHKIAHPSAAWFRVKKPELYLMLFFLLSFI